MECPSIFVLAWFATLEVKPLFIQPGSPWENGYCESFNGKMRYFLLDGEIFYTLLKARSAPLAKEVKLALVI
ncbi:MAG: hypothetical protein EB078_01370 [Proteobacteria bacterium]|nr:hypothetical protein [Pseudomonadota bacterium]